MVNQYCEPYTHLVLTRIFKLNFSVITSQTTNKNHGETVQLAHQACQESPALDHH